MDANVSFLASQKPANPQSVKVSVKHKPTAAKKFQTLFEILVKCVNIPCKY